MRVESRLVDLSVPPGGRPLEAAERAVATLARTETVIRWGLLCAPQTGLFKLEVGTLSEAAGQASPLSTAARGTPGTHVALIVPTGVGAEVGGYIGDAGPAVRAMEAVADTVIINPNVANAADFYGGGDRTLYVEGYILDEFLSGRASLARPVAGRIGLLLDCLSTDVERRLLIAADGMRSVRGTNIVGYASATSPLRARVKPSGIGHFLAEVENLDALLEPARILIAAGATSLAVCTDIGGITDAQWEDHYGGAGVNPVGAIEALISRSLTRVLGVPCVHAPADLPEISIGELPDPRTASELASRTGLPCLLEGLSHVGQMANAGLVVEDLTAIIMPAGCLGGPAVLGAVRSGVPVIAVDENLCRVGAAVDTLDLPASAVLRVATYAEAVGVVAALKMGVDPRTMRRPLSRLAALPQA